MAFLNFKQGVFWLLKKTKHPLHLFSVSLKSCVYGKVSAQITVANQQQSLFSQKLC